MSTQTWSANDYAENARFVSDLGQPVLELLSPRSGERILDLGCGDGALTEKLVEAGSSVVGVDLSPEFVAAASARGIDARLLDAHKLPFHDEFDAVFSNAVLHWMRDIDGVLDGVHMSLRTGGRFVGEFGGHGCVAAICTALRAVVYRRGLNAPAVWYFPTVEEFQTKLHKHGFEVTSIALIPRPTFLPAGMPAWLHTFAQPFLAGLPLEERQSAEQEAIELLRPSLCDASGNWTADYTRLRFSARRKSSR